MKHTAGRRSKDHRRRILLAMDLKGATERWQGIAEYAREAGWILESRLFAYRFWGQHQEYLTSTKFDGILSMVRKNDAVMEQLVKTAGVPVVDMWQENLELELPRVMPDHVAAGRLAAEHLMELGIKNLLFYSHTIDRPAVNYRRDGFREAARERGIKIQEFWWDSATTKLKKGQTRAGWLSEQIAELNHPLGVMAGNDFIAPDLLDAAELVGLRVPDDVAVVGADNDPILAELGAVSLTSVDIARENVGYEAAALLDRLINGEKPPKHPILVMPAGVIIRRSTEMLAISDPDIIKAVRYIQEHFRKSITVTDVVANTFLSRRRLQDRFMAELGHGMNQEIARQRVKCAQQLLTTSKHKITSIARMAGFSSVHRLSKVFKRDIGMTPQLYRQKYHATLAQ